MGRHTFDAVWAVPPQRRSRRSMFVGIGATSLAIILLVIVFIGLNPPLPDGQSTSGTTGTSEATGTAEPSTSDPAPTTGPASSVVLPVTILNNSPVNGLAARVATVLAASGWPIAALLNYSETQVPATTAFFTPGNATEEAAARAMVAQFPQISGGAKPRFEGLDGSGLTLAAIGDWVP